MPRNARLGLLVSAALALSVPLAAQERDPKLDVLAANLARDLSKSKFVKQKHGAAITYLVFDFSGTGGRSTQLGAHLADSLSDALQNRIPGLGPVERAKLMGLRRVRAQQGLDPAAPDWETNPWSPARMLGANIAIQGSIDSQGERFHLHLRALDMKSVTIATAGEDFEWTDERRAWDKLPVADFPRRTYLTGPVVRPSEPTPVCVYCPAPEMTEEARRQRFSGVVLVQVIVDEKGLVRDALVVRGQPYGLSEQAVAAVQNWRFKPPVDRDGNPRKLQFVIEVSFRIS